MKFTHPDNYKLLFALPVKNWLRLSEVHQHRPNHAAVWVVFCILVVILACQQGDPGLAFEMLDYRADLFWPHDRSLSHRIYSSLPKRIIQMYPPFSFPSDSQKYLVGYQHPRHAR